MYTKVFIENCIKNLIVLIGLGIFLWPVSSFLNSLQQVSFETMAIVSTLLANAFLIADYAFSYTNTHIERPSHRLLGHIIAGIIMFGTGASLEITMVASGLAIGTTFGPLVFLSILFYISLVLYDFWDLDRALRHHIRRSQLSELTH